jgi:hypothetical protein
MKIEKVNALIGKKKTELINQAPGGKKFVWSWNVNYGVTATLEPGESYKEALRNLNIELSRMVNESLGEENKVKLTLVVNQ